MGRPYQARDNGLDGMEYKAFTNQHILRPSADLLNINIKASGKKTNRPIHTGVHKGKAKLGIDYEGIEKGAPYVTETPNRNRIAQSIEVVNNKRLSVENNKTNSIGKPAQVY